MPPRTTRTIDRTATTMGRRRHARAGGKLATAPTMAPIATANPSVFHEFVNGSEKSPRIAAGTTNARRTAASIIVARLMMSNRVHRNFSFQETEDLRRLSSTGFADHG